MKYVALLRAINVGGKNVIRMSDLRAAFESMGFDSVETFIQSGNVIFDSPESSRARLERRIAAGLARKFGYRSRVLVRSRKELERTVKEMPKNFKNPKWKHNVIFLGPKINPGTLVKEMDLRGEDIESATWKPGVLYWSARIAVIGRSRMLKLSGRPEYQEMTVRNVNTTKAILAKMNSD